jgi:hypothetical protein
MNKQQQKVLTEAVLLENYYKLNIISENSGKYAKLIEQGILNRLKTVAKQTVGSWPGFGVEAGGDSPEEIEMQHPENAAKMKVFQSDLKNVQAKEKALREKKIGNNVLDLDNAMYYYVDSLIDLYGKHKDIINDEKKSEVFPDMFQKLKAAFETARSILGSIQKAAGEAASKISQTLKGSKLAGELSLPKTNIAKAPSSAGTALNTPRGDISARARGPLTTGGALRGAGPTAGGLAGGRLGENKVTKKLPSLKEVCNLD